MKNCKKFRDFGFQIPDPIFGFQIPEIKCRLKIFQKFRDFGSNIPDCSQKYIGRIAHW